MRQARVRSIAGTNAINAAVKLAETGPPTPERVAEALGRGNVGEEALAIGLMATLCTENLIDAVALAANHSGGSDSTAPVAEISRARCTAFVIPNPWLERLELREVIEGISGRPSTPSHDHERTSTNQPGSTIVTRSNQARPGGQGNARDDLLTGEIRG